MSVDAWQDELPLKTYLLGPADPNPPWQRTGMGRVYPYPMLDDLTDETRVVPYRALHVENEYLHLIVLPELGARLYSLYDKIAKREVFYRNNVVKYGLVARRGAWISGGIEFNFPQGHTCMAVSPVPSVIQENPGTGAASVVIGYTDRVSRMRCSVRLSLAPGEARLRQDVMLHNPMPYRQRHYFWANSAVPARDDLHLVYPAMKCRTLGGEQPYPIVEGRDMSWCRNHERPNDIFALDVAEDFFGCYYEEQDVGMVHWSDHRLDFGKKFFTWGTADEGMIWVDLLTDDDGQYVELQSGRFVDQSTFEFLFPFQSVRWTEYWYPVHGMGGFVWANEDVALNFRVEGNRAEMVLLGNRDIGPAELTLRACDGATGSLDVKELWRAPCTLSGGQPVRFDADVSRRPAPEAELWLVLCDGSHHFLEYDHPPRYLKEPPIALPGARARAADDPDVTPEELCTHATQAEKVSDLDRARQLYGRAIEKDPTFSRGHLGIGILDLLSGHEETAREHLEVAVGRDPENDEAWYYLAFACRENLDYDTWEEILWRLMGRTAYRNEAAIMLASGPSSRPWSTDVSALLKDAPDSPSVRFLKARDRRLDGVPWSPEEAGWEADDPLDASLAAERWLRARALSDTQGAKGAFARLREVLNDDPELWLEVALRYRVWEGPELLASACREIPVVASSPMVHYAVAASYSADGKGERAAAAACDPEYCFPSRLEEWDLLNRACIEGPDDWKARLLVGNLFASLGRRDEALGKWQEAAEIDDSNAVLCRNIGLAHTLWLGDQQTALAWYEKAIARRPDEYHLWLERDNALVASGATPERRLETFAAAPTEVRSRWEVAARRVECLVRLERWDEALELMQTHKFRPWEGARAMHSLWTQALVARAALRRAAGDAAGAVADYELALTYPRNLGVGRAAYPEEARVHWLLAEALGELGEAAKREEHLVAAAPAPLEPAPDGEWTVSDERAERRSS